MEKLFDNIERTYLGPSNFNESTFDFYNRSNRQDVGIIRAKLEEWFLAIPSSEKKEMKARFKKTFDDIFYELFLFNLFTKLGFSVEIHPTLLGTNKHPDFLIKKDQLEIYVEAKLALDKSRQKEALERMEYEFIDSLNKIKSDNFIIKIEQLEFISGRQPKTKNIRSEIEKELSKLDPNVVTNEILTNGSKSVEISYEDDDIKIVIKPMPIAESRRGTSNKRAIGMFPSKMYYDGGEDSIKDSIAEKAKRYGEMDKPYIICINALSPNTNSVEDVDNAIWGSLAISYSEDPNNRDEKLVRQPNGVFLDHKGPLRTNVSAVLVTQVTPSNIPYANYWFYQNLFAEKPIDFSQINLKTSFIKDGFCHSYTGNNLDEIFDISKSWLSK